MKLIACHYRTGERIEISFEDRRLKSIRKSTSKRRTNLLWGPGLFDIQCNGFAGVDFNHSSTTPKKIKATIGELYAHGTTHVLPTVITASADHMSSCLRTLTAACREYDEVRRAVVGIHLEGPFISKEEGYRGAHPMRHVKTPSMSLFRRLQDSASGGIRMITLAPELRGAINIVRKLSKSGLVVALGHTAAGHQTIEQSLGAGAHVSTHLGNAIPRELPRHENTVFAQLAEDNLFASFIPDGIHLPPPVLKTFLRAKPRDKIILTTDSMCAAGASAGTYTLGDLKLVVGPDRIVRFPGKSNFAGSSLTLDDGVWNAVKLGGMDLADAWDAASVNPWRLLNSARKVPPPRLLSNFILVSSGKGFKVRATVVNSELVWLAV
jgi:N-acetylglucosamine-6-phosphate deacetylase